MSSPPLFEKFQARGHAYAHRLRYLPELVNEAIAILRATFGEDWLAVEGDSSLTGGLRRHPIRDALNLAGDTQILDVMELCTYLRDVPGASNPLVLANLKASFGDTMPQLAFAYRLARAGAARVHLEPPASGGRFGDIGFEWHGMPFLAECYAPTVARRGDHPNEEVRLTTDVLRLFDGREDAIAVAIKLTKPLTASQRKAIAHAVYDTVRRKQLAGATLREVDGDLVSIAPTEWVGAGEDSRLVTHHHFDAVGQADQFARVSYVDRTEAFAILGAPPVGETGSCVAVWVDAATRAERSMAKPLGPELERLSVKTERKLRQTRREDDPNRLLVVRSWIAHQFQRASATEIDWVRRRLVDGHERVVGVLIVGRTWRSRESRHSYLIHPIASANRPGADVCEALRAQEESLAVPPQVL